MRDLLRALACFAITAPALPAQTAVPLEPIMAIVNAFRSHPIVALGDNHGNEQIHAFRIALLRDTRFQAAVDDIVVEFGSARYQDVIDRFVRGDEVPYASLRQVWQNTTQVEYDWDLPIYEEFFREVRAVNARSTREHRLRVLLGDPPIDWSRVRTRADLQREMGDRDAHAANLVRREVLAKGRKALVIYGDMHLSRRSTIGIVARLEQEGTTGVFSVHTDTRADWSSLHSGVSSWPKPSLISLQGTSPDFDALLYLGPTAEMKTAQLSRDLCADREYMEMRVSRLAILPPPPGAPFIPADRLKQYCAFSGEDIEIPDRDPGITAAVAQTLREAAAGKVDPSHLAPESRERLSAFLQNNGPRLLAPMGPLESLALLADSKVDGLRVRRYRSVHARGLKVIWTVALTSSGAIVSMDPRRE